MQDLRTKTLCELKLNSSITFYKLYSTNSSVWSKNVSIVPCIFPLKIRGENSLVRLFVVNKGK